MTQSRRARNEVKKWRLLGQWFEMQDDLAKYYVNESAIMLMRGVRLKHYEQCSSIKSGLGKKGAIELVYELGGAMAGRKREARG